MKYAIAAISAVILAVFYIYLHYWRYCNFEVGTAIVGLIASLFAVILNIALLFEIILLDAADLGKLKDEKPTVILGLLIIVIYITIDLFSTFFTLFYTPLKVC